MLWYRSEICNTQGLAIITFVRFCFGIASAFVGVAFPPLEGTITTLSDARLNPQNGGSKDST